MNLFKVLQSNKNYLTNSLITVQKLKKIQIVKVNGHLLLGLPGGCLIKNKFGQIFDYRSQDIIKYLEKTHIIQGQ